MHRLALLLSTTLVALATVAQAQQPAPDTDADTRARVHFQAATQYYDDGRFEEAVPEFREAWRLSQRPEMLLNLATAAEHALAFGDAAAAIQEYLQHVPNAENREALERRITRNQEAAARMAHGQTVAADTTNNLTPNPPLSGSPGPTPSSPPPASSGMSGLAVAGVVTLSVGAATLIGSLILGVVAHGDYGSLETECPMHVCLSDHSGEVSSAKTMADASTVLLFVGGALAAAGVVLLAIGLGEHHQDRATQARLEILPGPGEAGLTARLSL